MIPSEGSITQETSFMGKWDSRQLYCSIILPVSTVPEARFKKCGPAEPSSKYR